MNYTALKAELDAGHPDTGAYDVDSQLAADDINLVNRTRIKASMSGQAMFENTDNAEYGALSDSKKSEWLGFCGIDSHDPKTNGPAHLFVEYVFGNPSATRTNLLDARTEDVSRAIELGFGAVRGIDIKKARAL